MPDDHLFEYGYCLGLIVGEGSFTHAGGQGRYGAPICSLGLVEDLQPVLALQRRFGGRVTVGEAYGKVRYYWVLQGADLRRALPIFDALLPSSRKRDQYLAWRTKWSAFFARNAGR
jgi:hypothetical protein